MGPKAKTTQQLEQELALARARIAELESLAHPSAGGPSAADRAGATRELLHLFATATTRISYLDCVRDLLSRWTGCRCVGIRLIDPKRQIPYESYCGFDQEFWRQENCLSLDRDQCACIRVTKGCPEPQDAPYMTAGGSFVCNDADELVGRMGVEGLKRFRATCVKVGYKSITVLPLRYRDRIIGAIHMADRRLETFRNGIIEFIEAMNPLIGEAVHRFDMEDSLRQSNELFRAVFDQTYQFMALLGTDGRVHELNGASAELFGLKQPNTGPLFWELPSWDSRRKARSRLKHAITEAAQGHVVQYEAHAVRADGSEVAIDFSVKPVRDSGGAGLLPDRRGT